MNTSMRYLKRKEVDDNKWDQCIRDAENGLIYGYSWYLDAITEHWDALVLNDYDAVMPLTWRRKYGISYLFQPFCTPALGIFQKSGKKIFALDFLNAIPSVFKYWDIDLNEKNSIAHPRNGMLQRVNQILDLTKDYDSLRTEYSRLARRTLAKAGKNQLQVVKNVSPDVIVDLYRSNYAHHHKNSRRDYNALIKCCEMAVAKGMASSYTTQSPDGKTLSFYTVLTDSRHVYSLIGGSTMEGKNAGGFYLLTDAALKDHAGSGKLFRFEGSDNKGIFFFNSQFGAVTTSYLHIKENRLPFPLNLFKK